MIEEMYNEFFRRSDELEKNRHRMQPDAIRAAADELEELRLKIEWAIFDVDEPLIRNLLRWRVLDGQTWEQIARRKNKVKSWGHKTLKEYFDRVRGV